jgi:glycosyltransferase involved in cell wall biosynthesis
MARHPSTAQRRCLGLQACHHAARVARILMLTQPTDGGVFQHITRLSHGLRTRGHDVLVAGPLSSPPPDISAEVLQLDMVRAVSPVADARAVADAARLVRRVRPDLIHAHSSKAGAVGRLARPAYHRIPLVYTPHGYAFAGYMTSDAERRRYRAVERMLAPLATIVLCVCEAERRLATAVGPARRTRVVHSGIPDLAPASPAPGAAGLGEHGPVVGVLTLLRPGKGIETLIDAMPAVLARHPTASFVVAGEGPDRAQLSARALERGVDGALRLIGPTAGPEPLLAATDLFVSASWAESFPYNVLEAMAAALPVVATDVGGTGEAVVDGVTGALVAPRDPIALAGAISSLLDDPGRRERLGRAGRARQREQFTVDRMVEDTIGVYRGALGLP